MAEGTFAHFSRGALIFREGDKGDVMYVLKEGSVELRKRTGTAETVLKVVDKPNEFFGEMALVDGSPRSASAVAAAETVLIVVDEGVFESMILSNPTFALTIVKVLAARIRASNEQISDLSGSDLKERIARSIADYAIRSGEKIFDGGRKLPVAELKDWTNTRAGVAGDDFDAFLFRAVKQETFRWAAGSSATREAVIVPEDFVRNNDRRNVR